MEFNKPVPEVEGTEPIVVPVPEVQAGPSVPVTVPNPKPKRTVPSTRRVPSRNGNRQSTNKASAISKDLDGDDTNNKDGTAQDQKKVVRETAENNNEINTANNEKVGNELKQAALKLQQQVQQSSSFRKKTIPLPASYQSWKSQPRPSTAPPVVSLSATDLKSEATAANGKEEVNDFLKGSEIASASYQDVQNNSVGPNSTHQPEELVTPSLMSCLKGKDSRLGVKKSKGKSLVGLPGPFRSRPTTVDSNIVTFAPETLNIERENKPRRVRSHKNNRKPKFAHPCCGHFLPPNEEIMSFDSSIEDMDNSYTKYTQVWMHPSQRKSTESSTKLTIRKERLEKLLDEVSQIHRAFNTFSDEMKSKCLKKEIIPRYVMALDIVLTDGDLEQVDSLAKTIESSIRVLQAILHDDYFDENGQPKEMPQVPPEGPGYLQELGAIISALNKISSNRPRQETSFLGVESAFTKLQFELLSLSLCPVETVLFRCLVSVIPFTLRRIKRLLQDAADRDDPNYYIKWVNNSVLHRDYMAIIKDLGYADENGAKDGLPSSNKKAKIKETVTVTARPFSADADLSRGRSLERYWN